MIQSQRAELAEVQGSADAVETCPQDWEYYLASYIAYLIVREVAVDENEAIVLFPYYMTCRHKLKKWYYGPYFYITAVVHVQAPRPSPPRPGCEINSGPRPSTWE